MKKNYTLEHYCFFKQKVKTNITNKAFDINHEMDELLNLWEFISIDISTLPSLQKILSEKTIEDVLCYPEHEIKQLMTYDFLFQLMIGEYKGNARLSPNCIDFSSRLIRSSVISFKMYEWLPSSHNSSQQLINILLLPIIIGSIFYLLQHLNALPHRWLKACLIDCMSRYMYPSNAIGLLGLFPTILIVPLSILAPLADSTHLKTLINILLYSSLLIPNYLVLISELHGLLDTPKKYNTIREIITLCDQATLFADNTKTERSICHKLFDECSKDEAFDELIEERSVFLLK